ncbi:sensor histidine kinase [Rudanella lutea]|uniref:sensor histidine kinase n=1 Tax=Rudanella lutea TaxID=451374 RepID=UPI00036540B3|nr:ATP-binding protein [Rudanella lutea]
MNQLATLRQFPQFADVPDEQLTWFIQRAEFRAYAEQTTLQPAGGDVDFLTLVLKGRIWIDGGADELVIYDAPGILGVLPYSRLRQVTFPVIADPGAEALHLHRDHLRDMTGQCYELTEVMVRQMTDRVRDFTRQIQQEEKMASLGRLSAGLAHELNNPVSAVVRAADTLSEQMNATPERFKSLMAIQLPAEPVERVVQVMFQRLQQKPPTLTMLERNALEDELTDWLDDRNVAESGDLIDSLVQFGFSPADLDEIGRQIPSENLSAVLGWVVNTLETEKLVRDIGEASRRISELVKSIKSYTHMDRGEGREDVRLEEGIRNTLTLLNHKLRAKQIAVTLAIPDDLPTICGWPGELNQVWTNLIDNAIDAMPEGGQLQISAELDTRADGSAFVYTHVADTGTGIPDEIQPKIFDPFFTTKAIGQGSGLGLDIVRGIVRHHRGSIKVESEPGRTEFIICLPI